MSAPRCRHPRFVVLVERDDAGFAVSCRSALATARAAIVGPFDRNSAERSAGCGLLIDTSTLLLVRSRVRIIHRDGRAVAAIHEIGACRDASGLVRQGGGAGRAGRQRRGGSRGGGVGGALHGSLCQIPARRFGAEPGEPDDCRQRQREHGRHAARAIGTDCSKPAEDRAQTRRASPLCSRQLISASPALRSDWLDSRPARSN